jgi:hypothetical protein
MNYLQLLQSLGERFHGCDLQFRRSGTSWMGKWRARIHSTKNERSEWRLTAYGNTPEEAILNLQVQVNKIT